MHRTKLHKAHAVAAMMGTTVDSVRRYVDESGIDVQRMENGPRYRQFSLENIFDLCSWRRDNRQKSAPKKKVIATVYAPKGGVGKTTFASNFACLFSLMGRKTLVIDLDFQANLTLALGYDSELTRDQAAEDGKDAEMVVDYHFGHVMPNWIPARVPLKSALKMPYGQNGPHLIPADLTLDRLDTLLTYDALEGRKSDLKIAALIHEGLSGKNPNFDLSDYDVILFDAAPAKNRMTKGALIASDFVISPVSMEKFSTKAISYLSSVLTDMREDSGRSPNLIVVGNFCATNNIRVAKQISILSEEYPGSLLQKTIRRSEEFPKTLSTEEMDKDGEELMHVPPLVLAKPTSSAATEMRDVAMELLNKMGVA